MKKIISGTLLFIVISFIAQYISHFVVNTEHYGSVSFIREEPIFAFGFIAMILQGSVLSYLFKIYSKNGIDLKTGAVFGLLMSAFFVSYPALVEPAKYIVPSISSWIIVEATVGIIQFVLFGILLAIIFKKIR